MQPFCLVAGVVVLLLRWAPVPCVAWAPVARTITVDQRGGGQYTTVQAAVDAVPEGNSRWVRIYVRQGSYRFVEYAVPLIKYIDVNCEKIQLMLIYLLVNI